jgi:plasmid maintenance system antidote protein VapI
MGSINFEPFIALMRIQQCRMKQQGENTMWNNIQFNYELNRIERRAREEEAERRRIAEKLREEAETRKRKDAK